MASPVLLGSDAVRVGYLGRGGTATPALWLHAPPGAVMPLPTDPADPQIGGEPAGSHASAQPDADPSDSNRSAAVAPATDADHVTPSGPAGSPGLVPPGSSLDTIVTVDGRSVEANPDVLGGFVPVEGLGEFRCGVAASIAACASPALLAWSAGELEATLVARRLGVSGSVDLPRARRAACELATHGFPQLIEQLPLSPGERSWWTALAHLRRGDRDEAAERFGELPINGYAVVTVILRWASQRWVGDAASNARFLLGKRLNGTASQRLTQVSIACGITPLARFLLDPSSPLPESLRRVPGVVPSVARALALRGAALDEPLDVGPDVSLSVLDDLIDLRTPLDPATMSDEQRRHVVARSRPETLSDADVDQIGLTFERDRRRLAAARFDEIDAGLSDPHVSGVLHLLEHGEVNDQLRHVDAVRADELQAFLDSPSPATLTPGLVSDPSLWTILARRLDAPLYTWQDDLEPATQHFIGWYALRTTFDHLTDGDWAAALESGHHAHRLASGDAQRRDALNLIAFAHWQRDDGEAARDTLLSAIGGTDDVPLRVNLAIVASSLDPDSAALELARLVRESGSLDLRCAAAMRAVHLWSTDDLPWTARRRRPVPPELIDALRELVVADIDLGVFRSILGLQSNVDREWLARPAHLGVSPHRSSLEARVMHARATGPREFVDALTFALRSSTPPAWVTTERDRTVEIAARHVFDDDGSCALLALFAVQRKMPVSTEQRALLAPLAVLAVSEQTDPGADPPPDFYLQLLADADAFWSEVRPSPHVLHVMDAAWERLATCHVRFLELIIDKMVRAVEDLDRRLRRDPRQRRNVSALRTSLEPILDDAIAADDVLSEFRPHVSGAPIAREIDELLRTVRDIRRATMRML
jgi:hypothetical protein